MSKRSSFGRVSSGVGAEGLYVKGVAERVVSGRIWSELKGVKVVNSWEVSGSFLRLIRRRRRPKKLSFKSA